MKWFSIYSLTVWWLAPTKSLMAKNLKHMIKNLKHMTKICLSQSQRQKRKTLIWKQGNYKTWLKWKALVFFLRAKRNNNFLCSISLTAQIST